MKRNVGKPDRIIRVVVGLAAVALGIYFESWWGALGIIPLFTASIGRCPMYMPCGLSSCSIEEKNSTA